MSHLTARTAAVLASALVLTLGTAAVAQAAGSWSPAPCAAGVFTSAGVARGGFSPLDGEVSECGPTTHDTAFAIVVFRPQDFFAAAYPESLVTHRPGATTRFTGAIPAEEEVGVCAMPTLTERIACARVTWPAGGPATVEPIATTDPLVAIPVMFENRRLDPPVGFCGSCLEEPES